MSYQHSEENVSKFRAPAARLARTAVGSAVVGPTRYCDCLLVAPFPTLWEAITRAQNLQGRVAGRAIAHRMDSFCTCARRLGSLATQCTRTAFDMVGCC